MVMFLAGVPVAWLVYSGFMERLNDSALWRLQYIGGVIWLAMLIRFLWRNPPRNFCVILWIVSLIWHLQFIPFFVFVGFSLTLVYLVFHTGIMAGYSGLLLLRDRPQKLTTGEQDAPSNVW